MRIAIEGQRLFRKNKHGMDFVALELIRNLMQIDHTNQYFVFVASGDDKCLSNTANFKIIELPARFYPLWEQVSLPKAIKKYNCELLHCTSNTAPLFTKVPLITTIHDIIYLEQKNLLKSKATLYQRFGNLYRKFIVPLVFNKSNRVITVSEFEVEQIRAHFNVRSNSKHLSYIHNGVSKHFNSVTDPTTLGQIRAKYNLPKEFIFHLGNTDPKKNTEGVIRAYSLFIQKTNSKLMLVMPDFNAKALNEILNSINHPGLRNKIHLTGYIKNIDLPAIYSLSKLFLYPSLRESFGIPLLEAMSCGTPVITSNTSSMPEIAKNAALYANPYKVSDIVNQIITIETTPAIRIELIDRGYKRAAEFSWKAMAENYLSLYSTVIGKTAPAETVRNLSTASY